MGGIDSVVDVLCGVGVVVEWLGVCVICFCWVCGGDDFGVGMVVLVLEKMC